MNIQNIGKFLQQSRKEKKLTQAYVADELGISPQAISKWERGDNLPDASFFPDISRLYGISIEELLNGRKEEVKTFKNNFFDNEVFDNILEKLSTIELISDIDLSLDFYVYLGNEQKNAFIDAVLDKEDYHLILDEILPYSNNNHKRQIISEILEKKDYELLENFAVYMTNEMKEITLNKLLGEQEFDFIEDIITTFNRRQRDVIVEYFISQETEIEIIENFIPFFDKNQVEKIITKEVFF